MFRTAKVNITCPAPLRARSRLTPLVSAFGPDTLSGDAEKVIIRRVNTSAIVSKSFKVRSDSSNWRSDARLEYLVDQFAHTFFIRTFQGSNRLLDRIANHQDSRLAAAWPGSRIPEVRLDNTPVLLLRHGFLYKRS